MAVCSDLRRDSWEQCVLMRFEIAILNSGDSFFRFYGHFVAPGSNFQMFGGGNRECDEKIKKLFFFAQIACATLSSNGHEFSPRIAELLHLYTGDLNSQRRYKGLFSISQGNVFVLSPKIAIAA